MAGKGAIKRNTQRKKKRQKAKQAAGEFAENGATTISIPDIAEDDLLAFQLSHFGDDTKPATWFMDAETALHYQPEYEEEVEDDLGYYSDGVKRTLTDEQIAMFRHSEIEQLVREGKMQREEAEEQQQPQIEATVREAEHERRAGSPGSDASSIEIDLVGLAQPASLAPPAPSPQRQPSQSSRSDASDLTAGAKRQRKEQVPYYDRHKRKWEQYVEEEDPVEGSLTQRRLVRELDEIKDGTVELDY